MILETSLYIMGLALLCMSFVRYRIALHKASNDSEVQISFPLVFFGAVSFMMGVAMSCKTPALY